MDPTVDDNEPDAETIAAFTRLLERIGPTWLQKTKLPVSSDPAPASTPDLVSFLREALTEQKTQAATLTAQIEKMRDLLTPEQLIRLRSPAPDPTNGEKGNSDDAPAKPPKAAAPLAKPPSKLRWL